MNVDYCRALSASLFQGASDSVEYVEVVDSQAGFQALADGRVDVMAGAPWSLQTEVHEESAGRGFSFNFYGQNNDAEILALATSHGDNDLSSFVYWIVEATTCAEENSIDDLLSNGMPEVHVFGEAFKQVLRDAILSVGRFGQVCNRNTEELIPRTGRNQLNDMSDPGPPQRPPVGFFGFSSAKK